MSKQPVAKPDALVPRCPECGCRLMKKPGHDGPHQCQLASRKFLPDHPMFRLRYFELSERGAAWRWT